MSACGYLRLLGGGGNRRSFRAGWGRGNPRSLLIGIPIAAMQRLTIAVRDISDLPVLGGDSKCPRRFDRYTPHMGPRALESLGNHRPHHIASLVAKVAPAPLA